MPSNSTIAGVAGALIFAGASAASNGILDRFVLASVAAGSGFVASMGMTADRRQSCQDEIANAVRKAKQESERTRAQLEINHGLAIEKIRTDLQRQIDGLNAEKQALEAEYQAERTRIQNEYETRLNEAVQGHASALQGSQTEHARALARELGERDNRIEGMTRQHVATVAELHTKIADLTGQLERAKLNREELLRLEYGRDLHAMELQQKDDTIERLQNEIAGMHSRMAELGESIDSEFDEATQAGFKEASEQYEKAIAEMEREHGHQIGELETKIGRLETQLDKRKSRAAFEQSLDTLWQHLEDLLPLIVTAPQRRGKGTTCARVAMHYGQMCEAGIVPLTFDPSEGGQAGSTWDRAGIASFRDPYLALELLEAIEANADDLPISDPAMPAIMLGFDELTTCLDRLDKDSRKRFAELWRHTYTDWLKRRIFPVIMTHSRQVQNLNSGGEELLNGGMADTAFGSVLIDTEIAKFLKDRGESVKQTADLQEYLRAYDGQFTAAYFRAGKLTPLRHPTHHGLKIANAVAPVEAVEVRLAPCPDWMPHAIREIYRPYYERAVADDRAGATTCKPGASASTVQPVEAAPRQELHADPILQKWGAKAEELGFSPDELHALVSCVEAGKNQGDSLRSALGIKSRSGNPDSAYQRGRTLYQAIKSALVAA